MRVILVRTPLLGVLAFAVGFSWMPASVTAQTPTFIDKISAPAQVCLTAKSSGAGPDQVLPACQTALGDLGALDSGNPSQTQHEKNVVRMIRGFLSTQIAGQYLKIDGVRSDRICAQEETTWAALSGIVDAASPADWQTNFAEMRKAAVPAVTKCRSEKGAPPGAPPLPN
jgi:hypothetical protein